MVGPRHVASAEMVEPTSPERESVWWVVVVGLSLGISLGLGVVVVLAGPGSLG